MLATEPPGIVQPGETDRGLVQRCSGPVRGSAPPGGLCAARVAHDRQALALRQALLELRHFPLIVAAEWEERAQGRHGAPLPFLSPVPESLARLLRPALAQHAREQRWIHAAPQ